MALIASAGRHHVDCGLASVMWWSAFRAAARALMATRGFAPTNCLMFSTGWALIVRAGNLFGPTF